MNDIINKAAQEYADQTDTILKQHLNYLARRNGFEDMEAVMANPQWEFVVKNNSNNLTFKQEYTICLCEIKDREQVEINHEFKTTSK